MSKESVKDLELSYWPYCPECKTPFIFDRDEPFAHCRCGTTEWGNPRPAAYVRNPNELLLQEFYGVRTLTELVESMSYHIDKLQKLVLASYLREQPIRTNVREG